MSAALLVTAWMQLAADVGDPSVREAHITARGTAPDTTSVAVDDVVGGDVALLAVPGLGLARDGGPLAPARLLVRGLGGPRLAVDVAGLAFADPTSGEVDIALLPLALGVALVDVAGMAGAPSTGLGAGLSLRPAAGSRLQLAVGELGTLQGSLRLDVPVEHGRITTGIAAGTTRGDFPFVIENEGGGAGTGLIRANNDRRRINAGVVSDVGGPAPAGAGRIGVRVVAAGALHEGGIPGFATAPLVDLRGEQARGVIGGVVTWREGARHVAVGADVLGDRRRTHEPGRLDEVATLGGGVTVSLGDIVWADGDARIHGAVEGRGGGAVVVDAASRSEARVTASLSGKSPLGPHVIVDVAGDLGLAVVEDRDIVANVDGVGTATLPLAALTMAMSRRDGLARAGLSLRHRARAPSLDERFAPVGFVRGTPDLAPERVSEVEGRLGLKVPGMRGIGVDVAAFASQLDDAIVLVNKNAFEVAPENTGPARRAGFELGLVARPHELVTVTQAATLLWSEVEATDAPLPTAPPLGMRSGVVVGTADAFVGATVLGRGSAPSTIFGTLGSGAFVLVDLRARLPLGEAIALMLHVDNALDIRNARDQNLQPLPGRLAFVGLEVRP